MVGSSYYLIITQVLATMAKQFQIYHGIIQREIQNNKGTVIYFRQVFE